MGTELYNIKARAIGIPKKDLFGKADPYLVLRTPIYVKGESRISDKTDRRQRVFSGGCNAASIVTGISVTTAAVFASSLAVAVAPVVAGAAAVYAIKYASKLHPAKPGYHEIFVSERVKNTFTPDWSPFQLAMSEPFKDTEILFECWDWDRGKPSDYIGSCIIPVRMLLQATAEHKYEFFDHKGRHAGTMFITCTRSLPMFDVSLQKDDDDDSQVNFAHNTGCSNNYGTCADPNMANFSPVPCDTISGYGSSPAWGNGYDSLSSSTQSLDSSAGYNSSNSGYGNSSSGYDSASPIYGNPGYGASPGYGSNCGYGNASPGWGNGYDSLNSSTQSLGSSSGYGNQQNMWGSTGYDPVPSPAPWVSAQPSDLKGYGCNIGVYGDPNNSPAWPGGYAAQ